MNLDKFMVWLKVVELVMEIAVSAATLVTMYPNLVQIIAPTCS